MPRRTKYGQDECFTPEYRAWADMKARCLNEKHANYCSYGARGIGVHISWVDSYSNFIRDMGRKPSLKHSLDRVDNNKGYAPENCKWSTQAQQNQNTRATKLKPEDIIHIRKVFRAHPNFKRVFLAKKFGVDARTISGVIHNKKWRETCLL